MKAEIHEALSALVGKPLWSSGRAGLQWFQFGDRRVVTGFDGDVKEVGEYALHVQCAWSMTCHNRVLVASGDVYEQGIADSTGSRNTATRLHERVRQLFQGETRLFVPEQIEVGEAGGFRILFAEGYALLVMPDNSTDDEHWRLFRPYDEGPHFVVTGAGLQI